jgi:hypothetical protein
LSLTFTYCECLSFFLGGKALSDLVEKWIPKISAVRATVKYAIATKRLIFGSTDPLEGLTDSHKAPTPFSNTDDPTIVEVGRSFFSHLSYMPHV